MSWVRLDDGFTDHPKVLRAGPLASWLFVCSLTYCSRHGTDGLIPRAAVARLGDLPSVMRLANRLVEVGLWEQVGEDFAVHDYLEWQPSSSEVKARRERNNQRIAEWRAKRSGNDVTGSPCNTVTNGVGNEDVASSRAIAIPSSSRPRPEEEPDPPKAPPRGARSGASRGTRIPEDFEPSDEDLETLAKEGIPKHVALATVTEFVDYWRAVSGSKAVKVAWGATFRNRCRELQRQGRLPDIPEPKASGQRPLPSLAIPQPIPPPPEFQEAFLKLERKFL